jgi:hypothetical protein
MATIIKDKKAVVFNLRNPDRITTVIPTARKVMHKGRVLVAVPHKPDETRVLRQLGFELPDPMTVHYVWPQASGRYDPYATQVATASFATMHSRCFILNSMGTGKTVSALWAYDYLRKSQQVKKLLIVCPLSTMERTWADEVFKTFPHLEARVLYGTAERRKKLLADLSADIYIINTDGIRIIEPLLAKRKDIDCVVIDEVAMFRNQSTTRFKIMNEIINKQGVFRRVWALTGMPTPNSPTDAYAQCRLVTPTNPAVPKYFGQARDVLMDAKGPFKFVPKATANDTVMQWMQPSIRFSLDEVTELPEQVIIHRQSVMSATQQRAYTAMLGKLRAEVAGGQILAVNEAVKASKLVQIACLREGTEVLTSLGWVPIEEVTDSMKVWDGDEWVQQKGSIFKGVKQTITYAGVELTEDHLVLSKDGWATAKEMLNGRTSDGRRLDRATVRLPDGYKKSRAHQTRVRSLGVCLPLWGSRLAYEPVPTLKAQPETQTLRVRAREQNPRHVLYTPSQHMVAHETQMYRPELSRLPTVRRAWNNCVRAVAGQFRELLGRYERWLQRQTFARPYRQQRPVHQRELPLGDAYGASQQPEIKTSSFNPCVISAAQHTGVDAVQQGTKRASAAPVYDLVDCGPRNRFVVRGTDGELVIVHNCGVAYAIDGTRVMLPAPARMELLREIIAESDGKVIVFVPLTGALEHVASQLSDEWEVAVVHGATPKAERDVIFGAFQTTPAPHVLVANPGTMSHGLTLTAATTIIWFAPIYSLDIYGQANARIKRIGQDQKTRIVNIAGSPIEEKMYSRLENKESMQNLLLDMLEKQ